MSEQRNYEKQKEKLEKLCEENNLTFRFNHNEYPITLSIRPMQGMYEQISLLEAAEDGEGRISQDSVMTFVKKDGDISFRIFGMFSISESLQNKFKNVFKKMCESWEGHFFRAVIESHALRSGLMPVIDESEASDNEDHELIEEENEEELEPQITGATPSQEDEDLVTKATEIVRMENKCTTALLQRKLMLGYAKAAYIVDLLEQRGIVGPFKGNEPRDVLPVDVPEADE